MIISGTVNFSVSAAPLSDVGSILRTSTSCWSKNVDSPREGVVDEHMCCVVIIVVKMKYIFFFLFFFVLYLIYKGKTIFFFG